MKKRIGIVEVFFPKATTRKEVELWVTIRFPNRCCMWAVLYFESPQDEAACWMVVVEVQA